MLHSCGKLVIWLRQSCDLIGTWKFLSAGPSCKDSAQVHQTLFLPLEVGSGHETTFNYIAMVQHCTAYLWSTDHMTNTTDMDFARDQHDWYGKHKITISSSSRPRIPIIKFVLEVKFNRCNTMLVTAILMLFAKFWSVTISRELKSPQARSAQYAHAHSSLNWTTSGMHFLNFFYRTRWNNMASIEPTRVHAYKGGE